MQRLVELYNTYGQSPWLDNLKRGYLTSGELVKIRDSGIRGVTSNPSIFQKAIQGSPDYDEQYRSIAKDGRSVVDHYWDLVTSDIVGALEVFAPVYASSQGHDGFVSVEVAPTLAHDTAGTIAAARELWTRINRPNLMVKIPATAEGVPAIRQMISEGVNINVTLIFSLERYAEVMEAYISGLEAAKGPLGGIASVASFFISRVDSEVDHRLDAIGTPAALDLRGKAALAQGKLAYRLFRETFSTPRWHALVARGARPQRPLWASTSTKNAAYPDTLYIDELIGAETVNTIPEPTVASFVDHGTLGRTAIANPDQVDAAWAGLAKVGVDMDEVSGKLESEGVSSFIKSFDELLAALTVRGDEFRAQG
jgi:transaldolase